MWSGYFCLFLGDSLLVLMRLDYDSRSLNPVYSFDEVTQFDVIFPVSSHPYRCVNDCVPYISTTDIVSICCKLVRRDVLCQW